MARSSYVYIVEYDARETHWPAAGFTVKYELVRWLKGKRTEGRDLGCYRAYRTHDGGYPDAMVELDVTELVA